MTATRSPTTSASSGTFSGDAFLNEVAGNVKAMWDAACLPLTSVGGTANAVTATATPAFDGDGLVSGMRFLITWGATNTGGVTLDINSEGAVSVLDHEGTALAAGAVESGLVSLLHYDGSDLRVLSPLLVGGSGSTSRYQWTYDSSTTWNKPAGLDADTLVFVRAWGGGGGGGNQSADAGGGGGAYKESWFRLGDLPSSVSVGIGAGGATQSVGGNTTFGSLMTAFGGGATTGALGAEGGGELEAGGVDQSAGNYARLGGGQAVGTGIDGKPPTTLWGGASGGGYSADGGDALFGGAGGAGGNTRTGGTSVFGGAGGDTGAAGSVPGGGGGQGGAGAHGRLEVFI